MRMALIEFPVKGAADKFWIAHCLLEGDQMRFGELRIDVMKQQDVAGGHARAAIELQTATGASGRTEFHRSLHYRGRCVPCDSGDYYFVHERISRPEMAELHRNLNVLPTRNDQRYADFGRVVHLRLKVDRWGVGCRSYEIAP